MYTSLQPAQSVRACDSDLGRGLPLRDEKPLAGLRVVRLLEDDAHTRADRDIARLGAANVAEQANTGRIVYRDENHDIRYPAFEQGVHGMVYDGDTLDAADAHAGARSDVVASARTTKIFGWMLGVTAGTTGLNHQHSGGKIGPVMGIENREQPVLAEKACRHVRILIRVRRGRRSPARIPQPQGFAPRSRLGRSNLRALAVPLR